MDEFRSRGSVGEMKNARTDHPPQAAGWERQLVFIAAQKRRAMVRLPGGDPVKFFAQRTSKDAIEFPFLQDEDRSVTRAYGVYTALSFNAVRIARPSTFVVGRDGIIRYIYVGASQTDRAPLDEVFKVFDSMVG